MSDNPSEVITPSDQSPLVNLVTWVTMSIACLCAIVKIITKWAITQRQEADDAWMATALVFTVAVDIAISYTVNYGLGKHTSSISDTGMENLQKSLYSSELLYVISICLSKMPILHFLLSLAREATRLRVIRCVMIANIACMVIAAFCVAFQCALPQPWEVLTSSQCFNKNAFWEFFGFTDILIDLIIVILPIYLLHDLRIQRNRKISAMAAFAVRLMTVPLVILRLAFLVAEAPIDTSFSNIKTVIVTSVHANVSVIAACIPFFKPIMDAMQSGVMNSDLRTLNPTSGGNKQYSAQHLRNLDSNGKEEILGAKAAQEATTRNSSSLMNYWDHQKGEVQASIFAKNGQSTGRQSGRRGSSESRQQMIIRAETTIEVSENDGRDSV